MVVVVVVLVVVEVAVVVVVGDFQRLLSLNPATVLVVLFLGL